MNVEKHISQLLFEHDCVIVPYFGGFVGNYKPAKFNRTANKFSPPSKEISFNKNLTHNDGLLANRISREEKKSYEEANVVLKKFADDLKISLKKGEKIGLREIGMLFSDEHNNILFEPDYSANFLIDSFGLQSLHSPVVKKQEIQKEPTLREKTVEIKFTDRKPVPEKKTTVSNIKTRKYLKYAAVAVPLLFLLSWLPFNLDKINVNYSNLIPFAEKPIPVYAERREIPNLTAVRQVSQFSIPNSQFIFQENAETTEISLFEKDETEFAENKKIIVRLKEIFNQKPETRKHHIIGGCFEFLENAEKLVKHLRQKGFDAEIIDKHNGLYRVSFKSFRTRREALNALAQIKSNHNPSAWLLKK